MENYKIINIKHWKIELYVIFFLIFRMHLNLSIIFQLLIKHAFKKYC